jgi:hypothetical protein
MSKLSLQLLDNSLLSGSLRTLFRGDKHNIEWLGNFTGQFFCSFRIAFRPTNHPVDGNPRFLCLLIAGSPCIGIRLAKFFSDGFTLFAEHAVLPFQL